LAQAGITKQNNKFATRKNEMKPAPQIEHFVFSEKLKIEVNRMLKTKRAIFPLAHR